MIARFSFCGLLLAVLFVDLRKVQTLKYHVDSTLENLGIEVLRGASLSRERVTATAYLIRRPGNDRHRQRYGSIEDDTHTATFGTDRFDELRAALAESNTSYPLTQGL